MQHDDLNVDRGRSVVVCGGGMAGLTAALSAAEIGARVTVLEKAPTLGGSYALSGGNIWAYADFERLRALIPDGNPVLQQVVHSAVDEDRRWLGGHGVKLGERRVALDRGFGQLTEPIQAVGALEASLLRHNATIVLGKGLDSLRLREGRIIGVNAVNEYGVLESYESDAVVLATGGFQGNPELLSRHIVGDPTNLYLRSSGWNTGDGFLAALDAGASASPGLDKFYGHAMAAPPATFTQYHFQDATQYYGHRSVAMNMLGKRFVDESAGTGEEEVNRNLSQQPGGLGFYILDDQIAREASRPGRAATRVILERGQMLGMTVVIASTFQELVEGLALHGVPRTNALHTLETFASACRNGRGRDLSPPRVADPPLLQTPPYYAVAVKASITFTMGGLAIDNFGRVLRRTGSSSLIAQSISELAHHREIPVPGLYAAGCDVGNISHGGYAGGLASALTTGRLAGTQAARGLR